LDSDKVLLNLIALWQVGSGLYLILFNPAGQLYFAGYTDPYYFLMYGFFAAVLGAGILAWSDITKSRDAKQVALAVAVSLAVIVTIAFGTIILQGGMLPPQ
jgi:hypothetical protein